LLGSTPEELRTNPQFRRQRLVVLGKAGRPVAELDSEWEQLLRDFPHETPLHLHRYDLLRAANRVPDAHAVLNSFASTEPNNLFYLARLLEVRAEENNLEDAIAAMLKIFFAAVESSPWPADYAWEALKKAGFIDRAYHESRRSLEAGRRPTPRAFFILCSHVLQKAGTQKIIPQAFYSTYFPDRGVKELLKLLALADRCPWIDSVYRARALDLLNDVGHYRLVIKYWNKRRGELEATVDTWSQVGRSLASLRRNRELRQLAASWRKRRGVAMWTVANYIGCLSALRKEDLREIVSSSGDALRDLPHDHCARCLAHTKAEAHALLGDKNGLRETWARYRSYFDCKENPNEWFQDLRRPLLTDIPMMVRYLEQEQLGQYRRALWRLQWRHISKSLGGLKKRSGNLWWLWPLLWFALIVLTQLFRS
jgi:tetratricopeptide (TPR) repeat protein